MTGAGEAIIQLDGVTKRFGQNRAVDDITVDVPRGHCFGWLGPNGSGKTTLIRMMLGLARPTAGQIVVRGHQMPKESRAAMSRVGGVVEEPRFYPYMSGRANLAVWAAHYGGETASRIEPLLERVGLANRGDSKVGEYSLGMRQRLGVARALLNDPELLVLDEPTNGLDPAGLAEFRTMVRDMVEREGRTVFISSHILDEVQKMADHIAIVQAGRLVTFGSTESLLTGAVPTVSLRVSDAAAARSALGHVRGVAGVVDAGPGAVEVSLTEGGDELLAAVNAAIVGAGVGLFEARVARSSLEERFLEITAGSEPGELNQAGRP